MSAFFIATSALAPHERTGTPAKDEDVAERVTERLDRRSVFPAAFLDGSALLEASDVLEENAGPLGVLLWQCARDITLWSRTPSDQRIGLFAAKATWQLDEVEGDSTTLVGPLASLRETLFDPSHADPRVLGIACGHISRWAEGRGRVGTALVFAQAGALLNPASPRLALRVGRLARGRGEHARAEGWLHRSVVLAREGGDQEAHSWAYAALAYMYRLRGDLQESERSLQRSLRIAQRYSIPTRTASALHDLAMVHMDRASFGLAVAYAERAAALYGPRHTIIPQLTFDIGSTLSVLGRNAHAHTLLLRAIPHLHRPGQEVFPLASLAVAAAGIGDFQTHDALSARVVASVSESRNVELLASAVLNLARGAVLRGDRERAIRLATQSLDLATRLGERLTRAESVEFLQRVGSSEAPPSRAPAAEPEVVRRFEVLGTRLQSHLESWPAAS